jgi:hypothetical protein
MDPKRLVYIAVGCICILSGVFANQLRAAKPTQRVPILSGRLFLTVLGVFLILVGLFAPFSS